MDRCFGVNPSGSGTPRKITQSGSTYTLNYYSGGTDCSGTPSTTTSAELNQCVTYATIQYLKISTGTQSQGLTYTCTDNSANANIYLCNPSNSVGESSTGERIDVVTDCFVCRQSCVCRHHRRLRWSRRTLDLVRQYNHHKQNITSHTTYTMATSLLNKVLEAPLSLHVIM